MASFTQTISETVGGTEGTGNAADYTQSLSEAVGASDDTNNFTSSLPNAKIEWPEGNTLFEVNWRAISEALSGNGIIGKNHLNVTADSNNALQLNIDPGSVYYEGSKYTLSSQSSVTLSSGDSEDRWDTIVFDVSENSIKVLEGTASTDPEPPDVNGSQVFLAVVYVASNASDVGDTDILNWRAHALQASGMEFSDPNYEAESVQAALSEAVDKFLDATGDSLRGTLDVSDADLPFSVGTNSGAFGSLVDMKVDANAATDSEQSYTLSIDGNDFLTLYAESDGSGGVKNLTLEILQDVSFNFNQATDFVLENLSSSPTAGNSGRLFFDTNEGVVKVDDGNETRRIKGQINVESFTADESGTVKSANAGIMYATSVPDGSTLEVYQAGLLLSDGQPAPSGVDLIIASMDNAGGVTRESIVIQGDGSVQDDETGSPLASYENTSGSPTTVSLLVDNGNYNSGSGSDQDIIAVAQGEIV